MDAKRWDRVQVLFHAVSDLAPELQRESLQRTCPGDPTLIEEVLAMIRQDRKNSQFLDRPLEELASQALSESPSYRQVGSYRIERLLGEGGMGTVFLATRDDLGSSAAIKILRDAWISPARRQRFAAEQRTLAQLNHPNIARLLDADTLSDGTPYFVMEYIDGVHLDAFCESQKSSVAQRLLLFRQVCLAVQFAHQQAVIHRDIKPSNILVAADESVKLLDFGIARQLESLDLAADATRTALRFLTPRYASPEQLRGESLGVATDVYSLGAVLQRLLGDSGTGPGELSLLCQKATHEDAHQRYTSVEALARDVDRFLHGEPLEARPDALAYRVQKFVQRNRTAVIASALAIVSLAGLLAFFLVQLRTERNSALAEAARAQRIQRFMLGLFEGGDSEAGPANDLRVATLIDRGAKEAKALQQDPLIQAELYRTLGEINQKLGNLDRANVLFHSAMEQNADSNTLVSLGLLRVDQAKLDEAEALIRKGLDKAKQTLPPGHPQIADATDALGRVLQEKGKYEQAILVLEESVRLRAGGESGLAGSLYELANAHFYAGHYQQAQILNERVLAIRRRVYGESHPGVAEALINLGAVQQELGRYPQAEQLQRQALTINRAFFGESHHRTASSLTMVARALVFEKKLDEAVPLLSQALAIQERVFGKTHPRVASALNEIGNVAMARNRFEEARTAFTRMAEIYRQVYSGKHYLIGIATANVGGVYLREGDNIQAERLFREALAMFEQTLPPDHLNFGITRIKLGRALLRQKRYRDAQEQSFTGSNILKKQAAPSVTWLQSAQTDLAEIAKALPHSSP